VKLRREWIDDPPGELVRPDRAKEPLPAVLLIHELYRVEAARDSWARTLGFFAERLAA
jgi:dienelactone hydrolase